jgi:threonine aldolase
MNFSSDNASGAAPEILEAIRAANNGTARAYGEDVWTARLEKEMARVFACDVWVYPVLTGTAANALALAAVVPQYGAIFCHEGAHIATEECGAPEFFTGGARLVTLASRDGKLSPGQIERALAQFEKGSVHHAQPAAVSITQASDFGTCYRPEEIGAISSLAHSHGMKLHMDGARLANAIAFLGCTPAEATWRTGVDVLSYGATKNGAMGAEAIVFFNEEHARDFGYRRKKAGQLASKMRYVSVQLVCAFEEDRWLRWANHANALARQLAMRLATVEGVEIAWPVEANAVFAFLTDALIDRLHARGVSFYEWNAGSDGRRLVRLMTSFATPEDDIKRLIEAASG